MVKKPKLALVKNSTPKAKAEPKSKPAPAGHNSPELSDIERRAKLYRHFDTISEAREVKQAADAAYAKTRKAAKADGIILSDIDFMFRCTETEDEKIVPERLKREMEIAAWMNQPVNFQPDMFGRDPREPDVERAARAGTAAGWKGGNPVSGYGPGSAQDQAWMQAWHDANEQKHQAIASEIAKTQEAQKVGAQELLKKTKAGVGEPEPPFPPEEGAEVDPGEQLTNAEKEALRQSAPQFN